jgi:hypothetical protein
VLLVHFPTTLLQTIANPSSRLYYPEEIKDDQDRRNHQQRMNPTASARESWANASAKKAE